VGEEYYLLLYHTMTIFAYPKYNCTHNQIYTYTECTGLFILKTILENKIYAEL